ncbi:MAG: nucleotidyltransferase domain-containing protein [Candidatus Aenigmatarchaeota archaeon]
MRDKIIQKIKELYPTCEGAFLYGSRIEGYWDSNSDWDIGIIGKGRKIILGNLSFFPLTLEEIEKIAPRNIHHIKISILSKKVEPLMNEKVVKEAEIKAKYHIISYCFQKYGKLTGMEVLLNYLKENAFFNPVFKPSYLKFLNSNKVEEVAKIYDEIIGKSSFNLEYRSWRKIDNIFYLSTRTLSSFAFNPLATLVSALKVMRRYVREVREFQLNSK